MYKSGEDSGLHWIILSGTDIKNAGQKNIRLFSKPEKSLINNV